MTSSRVVRYALASLAVLTVACNQRAPILPRDATADTTTLHGVDLYPRLSPDIGRPDQRSRDILSPDTKSPPRTWSPSYSGTTSDLFAVWGASSADVFAVGQAGTILHYDGATWSQQPSPTTADLFALWGAASKNVFAAGAAGTILHYDGITWKPMSGASPSTMIAGLFGFGPSDVYAVGSSVLRFDGSQWTMFGPGSGAAIFGRKPPELVIVGPNGLMFQYDGTTWMKKLLSTSGHDLLALHGVGSHAFAVGTKLEIQHLDGAQWTPMFATHQPMTEALRGVWATAPNNIHAVGDGGYVFHSSGGSPWELEPQNTTEQLRGIWGTATGSDLFVVGRHGTILHGQ